MINLNSKAVKIVAKPDAGEGMVTLRVSSIAAKVAVDLGAKVPRFTLKLDGVPEVANYGETFPTVCLDAGFYRFPSRSMIEGYLSQVTVCSLSYAQ